MVTIKTDAEQKLLKMLDAIKGQSAGIRCIHMELSKLDNVDISQDNILNIICDIIGDHDVCLFACKDGDFFITARMQMSDLQEKLNNHLSVFLGLPVNNLITIYGMDKSHSAVYLLCEHKLNAILEQRKAIAQKLEKQTQDNILESQISTNIIENIQSQRRRRIKPTILIVEDDVFSRTLISTALQKEYDVIQAKNGEEAINLYTLHAPDIMFLDIELPDINGHQILQKITEFDENSYIVMLSGQGNRNNILNSIKEGAKGFIGKPFSKGKLLQYIEQCTASN